MMEIDKKSSPAKPEPMPVKGEESVLPGVIKDLKDRAIMGLEKYGVTLHTHNGRDGLMDAYQEALDLVMYLKQVLMEQKKTDLLMEATADLFIENLKEELED